MTPQQVANTLRMHAQALQHASKKLQSKGESDPEILLNLSVMLLNELAKHKVVHAQMVEEISQHIQGLTFYKLAPDAELAPLGKPPINDSIFESNDNDINS